MKNIILPSALGKRWTWDVRGRGFGVYYWGWVFKKLSIASTPKMKWPF